MSHQFGRFVLAGAALVVLTHCASGANKNAESSGPTAETARYEVAGREASAFAPPAPAATVVNDPLSFDVVIVGGGVAGMTGALYLTDAGKHVLLLESGSGLAKISTWSEGQNRIRYQRADRKAPDSAAEFLEILKHIGAPARKAKLAAPAEAYLLAGDLYADLWAPATLARLPGGFAIFERELRAAVAAGQVPVPPFESFHQFGGSMALDARSARTWIRSMAKTDGAMEDVIEFADIYCRSQLGASSGDVSAMLFASSIAADLEGAPAAVHRPSEALERIARTLVDRAQVFWGKTGAVATAIQSRPEGVEVLYNLDGKSHRVRAKFVVYAQPLKFAPALIEGYERLEPENSERMKKHAYGHVLEHRFSTDEPAYRGSLRTWIHSTEGDVPALVIDPFAAEEGQAGLVVHEPVLGSGQGDLSEAVVRARAGRASARVSELLKRLAAADVSKARASVTGVSTMRWPLGIHSAPPGAFTQTAAEMRQPFERVFFASNDLGAPTFEEALFRGHCAAVNILMRMNRSYKPEKWSRCPIEKPAQSSPAKK